MFYKIKYLIRCIKRLNYRKLFDTVKNVNKISGKNVVFLFFDIVYCGIVYGCGYMDYSLYKFYELKSFQRKTYVTRGINNSIVKKMNNSKYYYIFNNKVSFLNIYKDYIKRDWLPTYNLKFMDFERFISGKEDLIIKPIDGSCGVGVEKISVADFKSVQDMHNYIISKSNYLIEEVIAQHDNINKLNPYAVNTLRVTTINKHIVYAFIRIGNSTKPVDNINNGGMAAPINLISGIIDGVGYDKDMVTHEIHPKTKCKIKGTQIPYWNETLKLVEEVSKIIPEVGYVGWDIAITPNGPVLVEGNCHPGHDILQLPAHTPSKIGMLPVFNKYIPIS